MSETRWLGAPKRPLLEAGVVDVWRASLGSGGEQELLSPSERERAARFVRDGDGSRWAHARGILRALLGAYAEVDPATLRFAEGPHGKPALAAPHAELRFNLSHSGDLALYAFARDREVGVDVELPRARPVDTIAIAARTFEPAEAERLQALPSDERDQEFLRAWVRYEARLKCHGTGIGAADTRRTAADPWLHDLPIEPPVAAALAVERAPSEVRCWQWTGLR